MKRYKFWLKVLALILLLFLSVFSSFALSTLKTFYIEKHYNDKNLTLTYDRFLYLLKYNIIKEYIKQTAPPPLKDEDSPLKTFRITVKNKDINSLNQNLPQSGKDHFIKGYLKVSGDKKLYKIKLRYRGDSSLHWLYTQKSLRVKLLNNKVIDEAKTFNLINPPHDFSIIDCVAYEISKEIGLISPKYEPVRVFLNGRYMGVYIYLSQVDESLLRTYHRMPGSIYYGDLTPTKDTNLSKPASLSFDETLWVKKASRNAEQKLNREDIKLFVKAVSKMDDREFEIFVKTMLNHNKYYKFLALDTLFGGFHHDYAHNHKLYFDPYIGKFEPIEWDLRYWSASSYKDNSLYPLQLRLKNIPWFEAKRDKLTYEILKKYPAKKIIERLRYYEKLILRDLKSDIYKDTAKRPPLFPNGIVTTFTIDEFKNSIKGYEDTITQREKKLYHIYNDAKLSYMKKADKLILKVDGNSPIYFKKDKKTYILYPSRKKEKLKNLLPYLYGYYRLQPAPSFYEIKADIKDLEFKNYITQKKVIPKQENFKVKKLSTFTFSKPKKTITLEGNITVDKTMIFDKDTFVHIKSGTTFLLSPKTSIFFYGGVEAKGTKEAPILFKEKESKKPWGSIVIQGKSSSNSILEYCYFSNGSVTKRNLIYYTAQLNIHDTKDIKVQNCKIGRNYIGDDSMHIAYSKRVLVKDSSFYDARSDALDIDISDVNVSNCYFKDAKNDSLDIMTTKLYATNNTFFNSGDKGISVGEASKATISNSIFISNYIGIEIKDNSKVIAHNLTFKNSKRFSIHLYRKNKRYKYGGTFIGKKIRFLTGKKIEVDKNSKLELKR